ncbi:hypothetical protein J5N97_026240 [Dioscorea zingiberensis]|uniref:Carrier domain-containing protein n=1 Tax=Dioscorea zingiberensis TaxID=325984 RepID=A0A9D5H6M7_9LILI|nr:hypothetical protein J5N97_026240 [Dioscorea zingiberensis]
MQRKQIEDQFSKLHPCFPVETKIAIVGAGPSGLSAAYALAKLGYLNITGIFRTSMAGKIRRLKGGYTSMWQKLSDSLPYEVLCNTEVLKVSRNNDGASVLIQDAVGEQKLFEFDKIIVSGALPFKNGKIYRESETVAGLESEVLEMNDLEKELFSMVQTIDYYTTVLKIYGLEHLPVGFYYFAEFLEDPATIGHPVAMQKFYEDTDVFLFLVLWELWGHQRCSSDKEYMKNGYYEKLERELQGSQNTYYVGGLMAFELTERNSSYAIAMVQKHFTTDNVMPIFPYVKRLFPLVSSHKHQYHRQLGELPELEFPELPSLDSYLRFWGTHSVTENKPLYSWINEEGQPGDRVLLVHLPGLEFVDAFFGCIRAKLIPVPVLPPDPLQRGGQALLKIENISKTCNAVAILSTSSYHAAVRAGFVKQWVTLSTGSTGEAKGVMITHDGLIHNIKTMRKRYKSTSNTILVSWLPQYHHDMGLIGGLFTAMVSGGTAVLFSPMTFIRNPLLWLQTMSKYKATHSAGPNFAFELVIRRLEANRDNPQAFDLSSMIFLMVAAEPVRQKTMKKFIELCHPFGLSQETTHRAWEGGRDMDQQSQCWDWVLGQIQELSQKAFYNELGDHSGKRFTRTGDLGRVIDHKLFITGRIKDLIIVAGQIYTLQIWRRQLRMLPESLRPSLLCRHWCSEEILSTKGIRSQKFQIRLVYLLLQRLGEEKQLMKRLLIKLKQRVAEEHGVNVASDGTLSLAAEAKSARRRSLLRSLTTGTADGRRQRSLSLLGKNTSLPQSPVSGKGINEIIKFLKGLVSEQTGMHIDKISATDSLVSYGLDSIGVVRAAQKLSDYLGVPVGAVDVFTSTCLTDLAKFSMDLLSKSRPQSTAMPSCGLETEVDILQFDMESSRFQQIGIGFLQLLAIIYASFLLILPAYISSLASNNFLSLTSLVISRPSQFLLSLILAPLAWMFYIILTCFSISLFGNSLSSTKLCSYPRVSIWSIDFVKWWALNKVQEIASKVLAVHLRGTVFLRWNASVGPYAVIQKGSILGEDAIVSPLQKAEGSKPVFRSGKALNAPKVKAQMVSNKKSAKRAVANLPLLRSVKIQVRWSQKVYSLQKLGAIPREESDKRPLLFLADDFQTRVNSPDHMRYVFQLQLRPVPSDEADREVALDCTKPWDETMFPYLEIGEITIDQNLTAEDSEKLEFNPFYRCHEVDVIRATSSSQSASIDHGRSLIYEICQHLRNGHPLPGSWRNFIEQSDAKVDLSSCPMAAPVATKNGGVTLARPWHKTLWAATLQPLLQTFIPYFTLGLIIYAPLQWMLLIKEEKKLMLYWLLPFYYVVSGIMAALVCALAKWVLVGRKRRFMGSEVGEGVYVDSMAALLNPEMVEIERGGAVGRDAVLFGHIYEGEGGKVKYGKVRVCEGGFVGSRAVAMPGVVVDTGGTLSSLSIAMKDEIVRPR